METAPSLLSPRRTASPNRARRRVTAAAQVNMPDFSPMTSYGTALVLIAILALLARSRDAWTAWLAVTLSWLAWCGFIIVTRIYDPWWFGVFTDSAAAWILLRHPSTRIRSIIGSLFAVQILMHLAYGAQKTLFGVAGYDAYDLDLSLTGWMQLLIVGGWASGSAISRAMDIWRGLHPLGYRPGSSHLDGTQ